MGRLLGLPAADLADLGRTGGVAPCEAVLGRKDDRA